MITGKAKVITNIIPIINNRVEIGIINAMKTSRFIRRAIIYVGTKRGCRTYETIVAVGFFIL